MSDALRRCLAGSVQAGEITQGQADDVLARYTETVRAGERPDRAAAIVAERLAEEAAQRKRATALQIARLNDAKARAESHPRGMAAGVAAVFARDPWQEVSYSNVEARYRAVLAGLHAKFVDGIVAYRSKMAGLTRDRIGMRHLVREIYGENSGDTTARSAALAWKDATDAGVQLFVQAGGALFRKETWRLPQFWESAKVRAYGQEAFRDEMLSSMDDGRLQILDFDTGRPASREKAVRIIDDAYQRISTDGLSDLVPGQRGATALGNRRNMPRAFEWASSEAWFEFNEKFGVGEARLFDLLTGHLDGIARDIAMMQVLGPNPDATARYLIDVAKASKGEASAARVASWRLEALYDQVSGRANSPVSEGFATGGRSVRAFQVATKLGSALLSSVSDFGTLTLTAHWNGLPATRVMRSYMQFIAGGENMRAKAIRAGLGAESYTNRAAGAQRHQAEIVGYDLPSRLSDFTMRVSGLSAHTDSARQAFGWELLSYTTELLEGGGWDRAPSAFRRALGRYGIGEADWKVMQGAGLVDLGDGVRMLDHLALARAGAAEARVAAKLQQMLTAETDFAVPTPGAVERSWLTAGTRPGTAAGELFRSIVQFKTFPVTLMAMHGMRGLLALRSGDRGAYLAALAVSMTVTGALAIQMKEISKGRDPRDMEDHRFWMAAFVQGGAAGIIGDFLYAGMNREGRGFAMTMLGPTAGFAEDVVRLGLGNVPALTSEEDDASFGRDLARFARRNTPLTSLWYTRLAVDRLMWDRLQVLLDEDAPQDFRRLERRLRDEYEQDYFWRPGQTEPRRGPEFSAAVR